MNLRDCDRSSGHLFIRNLHVCTSFLPFAAPTFLDRSVPRQLSRSVSVSVSVSLSLSLSLVFSRAWSLLLEPTAELELKGYHAVRASAMVQVISLTKFAISNSVIVLSELRQAKDGSSWGGLK